jgi:hypothetical protein
VICRSWAGPTGQPACQLAPSSAAVTPLVVATKEGADADAPAGGPELALRVGGTVRAAAVDAEAAVRGLDWCAGGLAGSGCAAAESKSVGTPE